MPPLYEGDLLYMPTTFPGISATKAREILQQTDKIIKSFPEVHHVFGKIGRAETATDPAPFDMIETTIMLKDEKEWPVVTINDEHGKAAGRRRRTPDELVDAMNAAIQFPGLNNAWTMPIKTRIDMLATGIKTPVGIKVAGPDLAELERVAAEIEAVVRQVPNTGSVFAERVMGGNYIEFKIDRDEIARYGLRVRDVQDVLEVALGGMPLTTTVEGLERYTVNLRYDRDFRENLEALSKSSSPPPPARRFHSANSPRSKSSAPRWASRAKAPCPTPGSTWTCRASTSAPMCRWPARRQRGYRRRQNPAPQRLQHLLERSIRIHAPRQAAPRHRHPAHTADYRADHLPQHTVRDQNRYRDARGAVLIGRRVLDALSARVTTSASQSGSASSPSPASMPRPASSCCSTSTSPTSSGSRTAR